MVDSSYTPPTLQDTRQSQAKQRKLEEMFQVTSTRGREEEFRQKAFLAAGGAKLDQGTWRPTKLFRQGTEKACKTLDLQLRRNTVRTMKDFVAPPLDSAQRAAWSKWFTLGLSTDCGSDMVSMVHALKYFFKVNLWDFPDSALMCKRAFVGLCKPAIFTIGFYCN